MVRGMKSKEIIQKILDQCKIWSNGERIGTHYIISKFEFTKGYIAQEYILVLEAAENSGLFTISDRMGNPGLSSIKLTPEGIKCVEDFDWNYSKYLMDKSGAKVLPVTGEEPKKKPLEVVIKKKWNWYDTIFLVATLTSIGFSIYFGIRADNREQEVIDLKNDLKSRDTLLSEYQSDIQSLQDQLTIKDSLLEEQLTDTTNRSE